VSKEFGTALSDNTRTKDILNQDNPELCERIARSIGTHQIRELTVRRKEGPLFTSLLPTRARSPAHLAHPNRGSPMGEASLRPAHNLRFIMGCLRPSGTSCCSQPHSPRGG